ncbi:MAG: Hpt domain-containing protein [Flavobacteriia bacterium]|nr:Hpt domain-containing protein [Flavobacteriia bacterium]
MDAISKKTDLTFLVELSEGSNEFVREMVEEFLLQLPDTISKMQEYLDDKKWIELRNVAHKLKPSLDFMGLLSIKEIVKTLEKNCVDQVNLELVPGMVKEIIDTCSIGAEELKIEVLKY